MKKILLVIVAMAFLLVWSFVGQSDIQAQSATAKPTKIVVVDVARALSMCKENVERGQTQKQKATEVNAKLSDYEKRAQAIIEGLEEGFEVNSELYNRQMHEWFKVKAEAEALQNFETKKMERESRAWVDMVYKKLLAATAAVARQQGATLVVNFDNVPVQDSSIEALYNMIYNRTVLYSDPDFDITDKVIEHMDAAYAAAKRNQ